MSDVVAEETFKKLIKKTDYVVAEYRYAEKQKVDNGMEIMLSVKNITDSTVLLYMKKKKCVVRVLDSERFFVSPWPSMGDLLGVMV